MKKIEELNEEDKKTLEDIFKNYGYLCTKVPNATSFLIKT
jgi:hypothetical protein